MISLIDRGVKHHRDRGHHRHGEESLLDKQERERDRKDRKKDDDNKKGMRERPRDLLTIFE